jgi:LuxR family maltose regulon positive regulatory protein
MFLELAGEREAAGEAARSALENPEIEGRPFAELLAGGTLALVELARARPRIARACVDRALEVIRAAGIEEGPIAARIYSCEALLGLAEGDVAAARRAAERSLEHPFDTAPLLAWTLLVAAEAHARAGDFRAGREALDRADELLRTSPDPGPLPLLWDRVAAQVASSENNGAVPAEEVSPAELRVLRLLAEDLTRGEIASSLVVSVNTVKTHQRSLYRKLGTGERETAIARARAHGLLD